MVGSKDSSTKIYGVDLYENFRPYLLGGHTDSIVGCFFDENSLDVNTVSRNGQVRISHNNYSGIRYFDVFVFI